MVCVADWQYCTATLVADRTATNCLVAPSKHLLQPLCMTLSMYRSIAKTLLCVSCGFLAHAANAQSGPATYTFDFQITSDTYADFLNGPLFTAGTRGTGTATFAYQSAPPGSAGPFSFNYSYAAAPFNVQLSFGGYSLTLIDSSVMTPPEYGRRGIIVQDLPSSWPMDDAILFEGFSGPVAVPNSFGNLQTRYLHTQLGFFSSINSLANLDLSQQNVAAVTGHPNFTTFNIASIDPVLYGQVNGSITNFQPQVVSSIPEPSALYLFAMGFLGLGAFRKMRQRTGSV